MISRKDFYSYQYTKGEIDHADLLTSMDEQISRAQEEAGSRKVIMEKVEKWITACDEERWLEEYNRVRFFSCSCNQLNMLSNFYINN